MMILTVYDHEKSANIEVPVTPNSTFVDVLRCCKGLSDGKYCITGIFSNREERMVEPYDRPFEFVRRNGSFVRQFVIYKAGNENIFFKDASGHQDKKRFTLTDLANFVSYHEKVVEQHNKTIHAMEERLNKLRKEEMTRKRGETNLLTLLQSAEVQERRIQLVREQKGRPFPQKLRKAPGTTLEELKVLFRATDDEVRKLKRRIEGSMQRIKQCREPRNNFEQNLLLLQDSKMRQGGVGSSILSDELRNEIASNRRSGESNELDLKIKDLRNRLNLSRKSTTSSLGAPAVSESFQAPGSRSSNGIRPKSAIEILLKSGQSSSSKPLPASSASSSSSNNMSPLPIPLKTFEDVGSSTDIVQQQTADNVGSSVSQRQDVLHSEIPSSQQDICDSTSSSSSIDAISCQPISRDKSHINATSSSRPEPDDSSTHELAKLQDSSDQKRFVRFRQLPSITPTISSSSSSTTTIPPSTSLSHKRRQRVAAQVQRDESTSVTDDDRKASDAPPHVTDKPTPPFVKPTTKSYFYKVFQQTNDGSRISNSFSTSRHSQSSSNKVPETLASAGNIENLGKNKSEGALKYITPHDFTMSPTDVSNCDVVGEVSEDLTSSHPSTLHPNNSTVTFNGHPCIRLSDPSVEDPPIPLSQILPCDQQQKIPDKEHETPSHKTGRNMSPSLTPNSFNIIPSSPIIQVTPMSTTSDNLEGESDIFNITGNQSGVGLYDNESSSMPSNSSSLSSQLLHKVRSLKSIDDEDTESCHNLEHQTEIKDDSFFSIPVSSSLSVLENKEFNPSQCLGTETGDLSPKDASESGDVSPKDPTESFAASSYPYPFVEVLEQLDGSASIFRHSAGGLRSLRKRLSSEDFHHGDTLSFDNVPGHPEGNRNHLLAINLETVGNDISKGLQADFKPKCMPRRYFTDLGLGATSSVIDHVPSNEHPLVDLKANESIQSFESRSGVKDRCTNSVLPDILCIEGSVMQCVSFEDNLGKKSEIIVISPKENDNELDEKEPGIIIAGRDGNVSEEEDDKTSSDDDEDNDDDVTSTSDALADDDDKDDSFSPLIDSFCEISQNNDVNIMPIPEKVRIPFEPGKDQDTTHWLPSAVPSLVLDLETPTLVKGILKKTGGSKGKSESRVVFSPLAILLDAALQGELGVVEDIVKKHGHENMVNDEGITALHNAICAGHSDIAEFLVASGCDVNAADSDLWTPLHCAASCYNINLIQLLIESGACVFATTESEGETALDKCEDEEEDGGRCKKYLEEIQAKMMQVGAELYTAYDSQSLGSSDELHFSEGDVVVICNSGKESKFLKGGTNGGEEEEDCYIGDGWCLARNKRTDEEGYAPKNYLSLFPRVTTHS